MQLLVRDMLYIIKPDTIEYEHLPAILRDKKPRKIHFFVMPRMCVDTIEKVLDVIAAHEVLQRSYGNYTLRTCIHCLSITSRHRDGIINGELRYVRHMCDRRLHNYHIETCRWFNSGSPEWRHDRIYPELHIGATIRGHAIVDLDRGDGRKRVIIK